MAKLRLVALSFLPDAQDGRVRPVGRVLPGDKESWQYFDADQTEFRDEKGFRIKPTGRELWVDHERFAARAILSRSLLSDPTAGALPHLERLFELTPETPEFQLRVRTAADEIGKYIVRLWDT